MLSLSDSAGAGTPELRVESFFRKPGCAQQYLELPFGGWLQGLIAQLQAEEYSTSTIRQYLGWLRGPGEFLRAQGLHAHHLAEDGVLTSYLAHRNLLSLERRGRPLSMHSCRQLRWVVGRLVESARKSGHLMSSQVDSAPQPIPVAEDYLEFCQTHRGLGPSAMWIYRQWLERCRRFLANLEPPKELENATVEDLDAFTAQVGRGYSRSTTHRVVGLLRSFLRYRFLMGQEPRDRASWLDYPPIYREMRLPRHLTAGQLEAALSRIDRMSPIGKRDWAVWSLLIQYGLRAGEVAGLQLLDIDWEHHRLRVQRLKGGQLVLLPLVPRVAETLRDYLHRGRPATRSRAVFVTHVAPIRAFQSGSSLSQSCVRKYLIAEAGLPARGAHVLRHTVARQLREQGASIGAIRNVLGHQDTDTTAGYLRLAFEELREVAANYADLLP